MSSVLGSEGVIPGAQLYFSTTVATKEVTVFPINYRLAKKEDGTLILQGCFHWRQGTSGGQEWKDLETVDYGSK